MDRIKIEGDIFKISELPITKDEFDLVNDVIRANLDMLGFGFSGKIILKNE